MNKLTCVIVDDELGARNLIKGFFNRFFPQYQVLGEAASVIEAVALIDEVKPDLVLLDIEMPLGTGFDVVKKCNYTFFNVIFITAHNHYAIDAFKISAVDYLLKPLRVQDLREALIRFEERFSSNSSNSSVRVLMDNLSSESYENKRIVLPTIHGFEVLRFSNIIRCEAERNYTAFILENGKKILVSKTLKDFDEMLTEFGFFRVHQSFLVNLNKIAKYYRGQGGELEMSDGIRIPVSRSRKDELLKLFLT